MPVFIVGFLLMAIIRSVGDATLDNGGLALGIWSDNTWHVITSGIKEWAGYILATAMAGVGLGTSFRTMKGMGMKPFMVGFFTAALVGVTSLILVFVLGPLVRL